jgi:hypothetical protein
MSYPTPPTINNIPYAGNLQTQDENTFLSTQDIFQNYLANTFTNEINSSNAMAEFYEATSVTDNAWYSLVPTSTIDIDDPLLTSLSFSLADSNQSTLTDFGSNKIGFTKQYMLKAHVSVGYDLTGIDVVGKDWIYMIDSLASYDRHIAYLYNTTGLGVLTLDTWVDLTTAYQPNRWFRITFNPTYIAAGMKIIVADTSMLLEEFKFDIVVT